MKRNMANNIYNIISIVCQGFQNKFKIYLNHSNNNMNKNFMYKYMSVYDS